MSGNMSFFHLFWDASFVVQLVMLILLGLSVASWAMIIQRGKILRAARADADQAAWEITRLGRRHASFPAVAQLNPRGDTFYWIGPAGEALDDAAGTDFHAVREGRVSITPLQVDMTDHARLPAWQDWVGRR